MMRAAGFPCTRDAMRRAIDPGSLSNAPTAHPRLSTNVRFTWCIASGERSSYVNRQAWSLKYSVVESMKPSCRKLLKSVKDCCLFSFTITGTKLEQDVSSILAAPLGFLLSLDQPIRSGEHLRRNLNA